MPDCQPIAKEGCTQGYVVVGNLCCDGRDAQVPVLRPTDVGFDVALATPQVSPSATANCGCVGTVPGAGRGCELGHYAGAGHVPASQPWLECDQYFNSTPGTTTMSSLQGVSPVDDAAFLVDHFLAFAQAAVQRKQPFFAQISFHQNHIPYVSPPAFRAQYAQYDLNHQDYYGGLSAVDAQVGRIRETLQAWGVADSTFIALTADNGPENSVGGHGSTVFFNPGDNGGRLGRKRALTEGGIRLPGIVEYPPLVTAHREELGYFPASTSDFLPTLLDIVGGTPSLPWPLDGISLLPVLAGHVANRSKPIGWFSSSPWALQPPEVPSTVPCSTRPVQQPTLPSGFRTPFDQPQLAWTEGAMKLFACNPTPQVASTWRFALYNVVEDDRETRDLWPSLGPSVGAAMFERFLLWQASVKNSILRETKCTLREHLQNLH